MTVTPPTVADREVAALVFARDLREVVDGRQGRERGWTCTVIDPLTAVVHLVAHGTQAAATGPADEYHLSLKATYYDRFPPQGTFVTPPTEVNGEWREAQPGSTWLPNLNSSVTSPWFALHPAYNFPEVAGFPACTRQLICCSMNSDYYISHIPTDAQRWQQGRHRVIALVSCVADVLDSAAYLGRTTC